MLDFEQEIVICRPKLVRYAARIVGIGRAEDCVQQGLFNAWKARESFRGDCQFSTWITGIVRNECLISLKKNPDERNNELAVDFPDSSNTQESILGSLQSVRMIRVIMGLPPKYRDTVLHRIEGGALLGPKIKAQMLRARKMLLKNPEFEHVNCRA